MNNLPGGVHYAVCTSYQQKALVCGDNSKCYGVNLDGTTTTIADTNYQHPDGGVVGFKNKALIFGGTTDTSYFTEQYNDSNDSWEIVNSTNVWGSNYYYFSAVATADSVYSLGGANHESSIYVMDKNFNWELHAQSLMNGRSGHKSMINGVFYS